MIIDYYAHYYVSTTNSTITTNFIIYFYEGKILPHYRSFMGNMLLF